MELLSIDGKTPQAASAFEQAIALGPGIAPVLMRAANFDFAQGRMDHGSAMANRILRQTDAFDQVLFSYLTRSGLPVSRLAGKRFPRATGGAKLVLLASRLRFRGRLERSMVLDAAEPIA